MFKSNYWTCRDRAYLIRRAIADFERFGSQCMNGCVGDGGNARAAELAANTEEVLGLRPKTPEAGQKGVRI